MATKKKKTAAKKKAAPKTKKKAASKKQEAWTAASTLAALQKLATKKTLEGMARYGIPSTHALGVSVSALQQLAKRIGSQPGLCNELWATGVYEARMLTAYIDDAATLTVATLDARARDFDNWAIADTVTFACWDRSPHAWGRVFAWADDDAEFVKRGSFALLAAMALHGRVDDDELLKTLPLIERAAADERHLVQKGVSWALRSVLRRKPLQAASKALATKLAAQTTSKAARTTGTEALRALRELGVR